MINVDSILGKRLPNLEKHPKLKSNISKVCKKLLHEEEINQFLTDYAHLGAHKFLDQTMQRLGLSYTVDNWEIENIPTEGRVVVVSNHPLGSLDGITLLKLFSQVRSDVKIVTNEILSYLEPLNPFFLPVNNMDGKTSRSQYAAIEEALQDNKAVIFFPAGEVSRFRLNGIKDCEWRTGFLNIAKKTNSPILPVHVGGKNSRFFYGLSLISKPASLLLLVKEMFRKTQVTLPIRIGELIPTKAIDNLPENRKVSAQLFRKHVYGLTSDKKLVFDTVKPIAHPQPRQLIKSELEDCELLTTTKDGKQIYLLKEPKDSYLLTEIGRLREVSFRAVGEGTGQRIDVDGFDIHYHHIVLWDPEDLEIVGAYRVSKTQERDLSELYSSTLFDYQADFENIKQQGLELGRSFVQPKYWGKRSLDYLWYGIGAYLARYPEIRYLFGPVSISAEFNKELIEWMVFYYSKFFSNDACYATSKNPFDFSSSNKQMLIKTFADSDRQEGFRQLKHQLKIFNKTVPTLYKQYSEICEEGGVVFSTFNVDPLFNDCVDGLVIVDTNKLLEKKRKKYLPVVDKD